ncbi:MAG TPA: hypothetical protein VI653_00555 [Steroidobacteraceae bacterium]
MDPISSVAFELTPAARPVQEPAAIPTSYNIQDVAHFGALYTQQAAAPTAPAATTTAEQSGFNTVIAALQNLNGRAEGLGSKTLHLGSRDGVLQPGDMLMMAMKAHEFLFHCELTSNVANRTSDGVQQLFREQS